MQKSRSSKDSSLKSIMVGTKPTAKTEKKAKSSLSDKSKEKKNKPIKKLRFTDQMSTSAFSSRTKLKTVVDSDEESVNEMHRLTPVIECTMSSRDKGNPDKPAYTVKKSSSADPESTSRMKIAEVRKRDRGRMRPLSRVVVSRVKAPLVTKATAMKAKARLRYRIGLDGRMIAREPQVLTYAADCDKTTVMDNFDRMGFVNVLPEEYWHVYWASVQTARAMFSLDGGYRMNDNQLFNHFPNHYELSRKDLLVKNIKRYRKSLERDYNPIASRDEHGNFLYLDFIPTTYNLPLDYNLFVEEYRRNPASTWIMKPSGRSQGSGIFLVNRLSMLKKWCKENEAGHIHNNTLSKDSYVISRYIDNPFLIGGKKFDLRLYVLVTSFKPLKAYQFTEGFCRFCTVKYDASTTEIDNMFVHLTNVAIQKTGEEYNDSHGGKLTLENLRLYVEGTQGREKSQQLFTSISWVICHSLKAVAPIMSSDRHCFECYGYDIIVDSNLKPWLVEVNSAPSLSSTTVQDRIMKFKLVGDVLAIVLPPDGMPDVHWDKCPDKDALGNFELLIDESAMPPDKLNRLWGTTARSSVDQSTADASSVKSSNAGGRSSGRVPASDGSSGWATISDRSSGWSTISSQSSSWGTASTRSKAGGGPSGRSSGWGMASNRSSLWGTTSNRSSGWATASVQSSGGRSSNT